LIHAYGEDINGNKIRLNTQFFGSGGYSITNKTNGAFKAQDQTQMGTLNHETMILARSCEIPRKQNPDYLIKRAKVSDFTKRFLGERTLFSKAMIAAQPYHLLIPHWEYKNTLFGAPMKSITFELYNFCIDKNFNVNHKELIDYFTVKETP
jgi:hypothetical protein